MPDTSDCQVMDIRHPNHGRLIVRRFIVPSGTSNNSSPLTLPPGYFSKLIVAIANRLPRFESIEIFNGAVEINYVSPETEKVQLIVRKDTTDSFFLVIATSSHVCRPLSSGEKYSTAWKYYLEIISLLYNSENIFLEKIVWDTWEYQGLSLEEECFDLKELISKAFLRYVVCDSEAPSVKAG
jgi:hypothetical protein